MDQQLKKLPPGHPKQLNQKNVGVPVYCNDKYSLYSTDTEERIISMDRGLGRCTAMLKSLMEENMDAIRTKDKGKEEVRVKPPLTSKKGRVLSNKLIRQGSKEEKGTPRNIDRKKGGGGSPRPQTKPLEQGKDRHHVRPAACSTPNSRPDATRQHARAKTEPGDGHLVRKRACSTPPPATGSKGMLHHSRSTEDMQQHSSPHRRNIKAHRRLKTEPDAIQFPTGAKSSSDKLPTGAKSSNDKFPTGAKSSSDKFPTGAKSSSDKFPTGAKSSSDKFPTGAKSSSDKFPTGAKSSSDKFPTGAKSSSDKKETCTLKVSKSPLMNQEPIPETTTAHQPPPPPPLFHPIYFPYNFPYFPPYSYPFYPHITPTDWRPQAPTEAEKCAPRPPETHQTETASLPPASHHHHHHPPQFPRTMPNFPEDYYDYCRGFPRVANQSVKDEVPGVWEVTPAAQQPIQSCGGGGNTNETEPFYHQIPDIEGMGLLLYQLFTSCEESVEKIRTECENSHLLPKLEDLRKSLKHYKQHLCQQCQRLNEDQKKDKLSEPSVVDLLSRIQELEKERNGLIESLKESCTAYTEVRRDLDDLEKQKKNQDRELEEKREQVSNLQSEFDTVSSSLGQTVADLRMTKEALASAKSDAHSSSQELMVENAALQEKIHSLFKEMTRAKNKNQKLVEELSTAKRFQETSKDEEEMMKVTVLEKNAQLLQAEDRLLGLRQCFAHFLSGLSKFDPLGHFGAEIGKSPLYCVSEDAVEKLKLLADEGNIDGFLASCTDKSSSFDVMEESQGSLISSTSSTITSGELLESESRCNVITPVANNSNLSSDSTLMRQTMGYRYAHKSMADSTYSMKEEEEGSSRMSGHSTSSQSHKEPFDKHHHRNQFSRYSRFKSSPSHSSSVDVKSSITTSSEIDFRNDLASLDANIARLQTQFRVALQPSVSL